ncbi:MULTISPECIES: hypothetical protein [Xanthomonas]|uniref:hypothetical protein n=1 Tax=Xanthomonas TaxID=338 RepID=UPI00096D2FF1|nr:hypothetical protein [Xanthomonas campestris]MEB1153582.1 hypothetical protein [Xanthomonas campestris pv. campestris]MCC5092533.1 hypothetical protein [Xanthomonas campestris pv. incanae]MCC5099455.1 hypothetical protein [Xanthomonas campestris]MEA9585678.1 hypothetical protein [Xanthomonas campestris]MEA9594153.1 hypothetical protein [Xanthomonas campestris]
MATTNHYHDQIQRATERLAHLQAKRLLVNQRQESKKKEAEMREQAKRRVRIAELVFLVGAESLDDSEITAALRSHMSRRAMTSKTTTGNADHPINPHI